MKAQTIVFIVLFLAACSDKQQQSANNKSVQNRSDTTVPVLPIEDTTVITIPSIPLKSASRIEALSYQMRYDWDKRSNKESLIRNGHLDFDTSHISERKVLSGSEIRRLFRILYPRAVTNKGTTTVTTRSCMFQPRNAFIFYDKRGRAYAYLEICFHCDQYELSEGYHMNLRDDSWPALELLLKSAGIKYGYKDS